MKKSSLLVIVVSVILSLSLHGQSGTVMDTDSLVSLFGRQMNVYPQEKIYLHTDKPYYMAGERIWFRAHLVDAASHRPMAISRYVYVELIDPLDSLVSRIKLRPEENAYYGQIPVPDDLPEGNYMLRAYTNFMRNAGEDYFAVKNIRIGTPQTGLISADAQFEFEQADRPAVTIRFRNAKNQSVITPEQVEMKINEGKPVDVDVAPDGSVNLQFKLPADSKQRVLKVEMKKDNRLCREYIPIPVPDQAFHVAFFPEGGHLLEEVACQVAFKAIQPTGLSTEITGEVFDEADNQVISFASIYGGMGGFRLYPEKGKKYHAICKNAKGVSQRFDLPVAQAGQHALKITQARERLLVSVQKTKDVGNDTLYMVAHNRGRVQFSGLWDHAKGFISFRQNIFPSGILHILLLDARMHPLSERLVFINNADQAQATYATDRSSYTGRMLVRNHVKLSDSQGNMLTGNFSVAVTDDNEVKTDSCADILTNLLLSSDLRGNIEQPTFYFKNTNLSVLALDLLMQTQGWRRYDIPGLLQGKISQPTTYLEAGPEISGQVKGLAGKPVANTEVSIMTMNGNYVETARTDPSGYFYFHNCEQPDSTIFVVNVTPPKGLKRMEVLLNKDSYPRPAYFPPALQIAGKDDLSRYIDKAGQKYTYENGIRMIHLSEVEIKAKPKVKNKSFFYTYPDNTLTEEQIEKAAAVDVRGLLLRTPGVAISGNNITVRGGTPLLVVDDLMMDINDIFTLNVNDISQIDVLKNAANTSMFGPQGANGVIAVFTKRGDGVKASNKVFHIKMTKPLGYQKPVAFYAPKYETRQEKSSQTPDLRTTIHWQPNVQTDENGSAAFEFYTADASATYSVIIEGVASDGRIIREKGTLSVTPGLSHP